MKVSFAGSEPERAVHNEEHAGDRTNWIRRPKGRMTSARFLPSFLRPQSFPAKFTACQIPNHLRAFAH